MKAKIWAIINVIAYLGMVAVNALANALPLNGITTGEVSAMFPNFIVPAGFTFSIWGLIYLLLLIFVVYQLVMAFRGKSGTTHFISEIGPFFLLGSMSNAGWIFAWHFLQIPLSLLIMFFLLIFLIITYVRLHVGRSSANAATRYMVHLPFSIYLGWITVATIVNAAVVLIVAGWDRFGMTEPFWTIVMLITGVILASIMIISRKDIFYALTIAWAYFGIFYQHYFLAPDPIEGAVMSIVTVVILVILCVLILIQLLRGKVY